MQVPIEPRKFNERWLLKCYLLTRRALAPSSASNTLKNCTQSAQYRHYLRVLTDASSLKSQLLESVLGCPLPYPIFRKIWHLAKSTAKLYNAETSISQQRAIGSRAFHVREVSSAIDCNTLGDATMFKCSGTNENFRRLRCNALSAPWAIRLTVSRDVLFKGTQQTESMRWICLTASNSI